MAATSTTETWDAAWTLTNRARRSRLTDNIFDAYPTLDMFRRSGNIEVEPGGKEIQEDLLYGKNSLTWFGGYDTLPTAAIDGITAAFYNWRYASVPITISMTEEQENRSSAGAKKLLAAKADQSMQTLRDGINAAIYSAQSGKSMLGFQDLIADSPSSGTLGGINRANESWWRNTADTTSTNFNNATGDFYDGFTRLSAIYNAISDGGDEPTDIFMPSTLFAEALEILESKAYARFNMGSTPNIGGGRQGNEGPMFRGARMHKDLDCASDHIYMVNSRYLKLKVQSGLNFAKTPFKEPANQLAKVAFNVVALQLTSNNLRRQGVGTNFS